ncbi:hypothetical protein FP744_10005064 [Trichoderma asperellum]|nr:hypothetical protein LI328DRAFT_166600 [Trichoderma asperelloides]
MLSILGGAQEESYTALVDQIYSIYEPDMNTCLHSTAKYLSPLANWTYYRHFSLFQCQPEQLAAPLIKEVDSIRQARLNIKIRTALSQRCPAAQPAIASPALSRNTTNPLVVVVMGADSDLHVLRGAFEVLKHFRVPYNSLSTPRTSHQTP